MLAILLACSEYAYHTKPDHGGTADSGSPWSWTDQDTAGPGGVSENLDEYVVEGSNTTDFVFFGDTSGSMTEELVTLGEKMEAFVAVLDAAEVDWQLAAVTGPSGCSTSGVLDRYIDDAPALFAAAILTPPGEDLVDEWGLYNVANVVENTDAGECNEGLLRSNANLHIVFLSDENDDSPGSETGDSEYWRSYVDQIVAKKGSASAVTLSSIVGPVPDGCEGADPGYGYYEATQGTGGEALSLCDPDWPNQVNVLATAAVTQSRFDLTQVPVAETIEVRVEGVLNTTDWSYVSAGNYVEFTANIPTSGQVVEIHYLVSG